METGSFLYDFNRDTDILLQILSKLLHLLSAEKHIVLVRLTSPQPFRFCHSERMIRLQMDGCHGPDRF